MKKSEFLKLKPMLLQEVDKPFNDKNYLFEIKYDGIRSLIYIDNNDIYIKSRGNVILNDIYKELLEIKNLVKDTCILDGEIVLFTDGKISFSKLQERLRIKDKNKIDYMQENYPVTFICFDILYKNKDLTNIPLIKRKEILNTIDDTNYFIKSKYIENNGIHLFNFIKKENLEGIVAKKKNSTYTYNKRVSHWLKIKNYITENFYIYGFIDNEDKYVISLVLGEKNYFVGKVILSKKDKLYQKLKKEKITNNYLVNYNDNNTTYIKPKHSIVISYLERTKNNYLRGAFIKEINN